MFEKQIDLSTWKGGVTLNVLFDVTGSVAPFLVFITNPDRSVIFYYRVIDKQMVEINLPEHPDQVILFSGHPIKQVLIGDIRITHLDYRFNTDIITPRNYAFSEIQTQVVPFIPGPDGRPSMQPARFLPSEGIKQLSAMVMERMPQPVRVFINEHENGHYFYGRPTPVPEIMAMLSPAEQAYYDGIAQQDEEEADRYAVYKVINDGYNFSNALNAVTDFLSDNYVSKARMEKVFNTIQAEHKNFRYD